MTAVAGPAPLAPGALRGVRVVEMGPGHRRPLRRQDAREFGAEVIKIEPPGTGDPLRNWRMLKDGSSVWRRVQSRDKRSVALDLRTTGWLSPLIGHNVPTPIVKAGRRVDLHLRRRNSS